MKRQLHLNEANRFLQNSWGHQLRYFAIGAVVILSLLVGMQASVLGAGDVHIVHASETLSGIAARYGLTMVQLQRWNHLSDPDLIYVGQRLRLTPLGTGALEERVYTVHWGDTLSGIARRYGMATEALAAYNDIQISNFIYVGQQLRIPEEAPSLAATKPAPTGPPVSVYVVQRGDTLSAIAYRFNTTILSLSYANQLSNVNTIYAGQKLRIPLSQLSYNGAKKLVIRISRQHCDLYNNNVLIYSWRCSTGRSGWGTRTGTFYVHSKIPRAYGSKWNIWMPYWLGIYWAGASENGVHGLPWNANTGQQVWPGYVGTPITFGCVMLDNLAARTLFTLAYIGMPVVVLP